MNQHSRQRSRCKVGRGAAVRMRRDKENSEHGIFEALLEAQEYIAERREEVTNADVGIEVKERAVDTREIIGPNEMMFPQ